MAMTKEQLKEKYGDEKVLCVPNDKLELAYGDIQGRVEALIETIKNYGYYEYRYNAELDFDARQVIPYVVLRNNDKYFVTERIQGDERLVGKLSIAVGGHVDEIDCKGDLHTTDGAQDTIIECIMRELDEETTANLDDGFSAQYHTTFVDDREEVSKVHVCLLTFVDLVNKDVDIKETEKLKGQWLTLKEIESRKDSLEGWSEVTLDIIKEA